MNRVLCVVLLGLGVLACACSREGAAASQGGDRPIRVVATTGMVADLARNVGGERVDVSALMGAGVDPHLYKASPSDIRRLEDADLILYSGLHLEGKMQDLFEKLAARKPVTCVTDGIERSALRASTSFGGHYDPHVWFDVELWSRCVPGVVEALTRLDPQHAAEFGARADAYVARLRDVHARVKERIATIPPDRRVMVTAHDAFGYFGRVYDLEVRGVQGLSTESEASLKDINDLVDTLVQRKIPAVFVESSVPRKNIEALLEGAASRGHTVRVGGELFSDAMGKEGTPEGTYEGMVEHNVRVIVEALGGGAPA